MYQIIIKNGIVIDPANRFHGQADVAVAEGKIAGIGQYSNDAVMVVDASGCIVTPGAFPPELPLRWMQAALAAILFQPTSCSWIRAS